MADEPQDPNIPNPDAGVAFRAEMAAQNFVLGYWKHGVALVVLILFGVFVYGQYSTMQLAAQRGYAEQIAEAQKSLPTIAPSGPTDEDRETLIAVADELSAVGQEARGTAAVEAWLRAAEIYRVANATAQQRKALEAAVALDAGAGPLRFAAQGALANLDLEQGDGDAAVARLTRLSEELDGYLAEQATLDLGLALEHLDRTEQAVEVYDRFLETWPDSPRADEARLRRGRLTG